MISFVKSYFKRAFLVTTAAQSWINWNEKFQLILLLYQFILYLIIAFWKNLKESIILLSAATILFKIIIFQKASWYCIWLQSIKWFKIQFFLN